MFKETFWEEEPMFEDIPERERALRQSLEEELQEERRIYEQFKNNREPFEWYCYEEDDSAA